MKKAVRIMWVMILAILVSFAVSAQQRDTKKQPKHTTHTTKDSTDRVYGGSVKQNAREKDTNDKNWKPHNPAEITPDRSSNITDRKIRNTSTQAQDSSRSVDVLGTDTGTPARSTSPDNQVLQPDGTNTVQRATYNIAGATEPSSNKKSAVKNTTNASSANSPTSKENTAQVKQNDADKDKAKQDKKKSKKRSKKSKD